MDFTFQQLTKLIGTLQECTLHLGKEECRENTAVGPLLSIGHNWQTLASLIWAGIIIGLLVQNFVLTFVWSQITILNNSAVQNWKQNSEWIGYFRQQQQQQTETEMMSFSQLLSTSQINCHKGSEVALALVTTGVCGRDGCGTMVSERVFVSHCPGHLLLNLWWAFNFGEQQRD